MFGETDGVSSTAVGHHMVFQQFRGQLAFHSNPVKMNPFCRRGFQVL